MFFDVPIGFMIMQLLFLAVPVGALGFFGWLALRWVRTRERDVVTRVRPVQPDVVERLQDAVLSLQSEVHALRERQEFLEKLLERPRSGHTIE